MSRAVNFALTDEQQDFVASIRDFCKREVGTSEQRERLTDGYTHAHSASSTRRWPTSAGSG